MNKYKLGELLSIKHGYAFKSENYVQESKYTLVTLANISEQNNFQFYREKATFYGAPFPNEFILHDGDLIMPLTEQVTGLFGNSAFVPSEDGIVFVLNQRVGKVIPKDGKADKYYLHYLLATKSVKDQLEYRASGTRQRNISPKDVYDVDVYVPEYETQRRIGEILYEFEKKINNNNKINAKLESLAKTIYGYWFLQYEFPNEEGKPYKFSGGEMIWNEELKREIPQNWKIGSFGDIIVENPKSTIQVNQITSAVTGFPFFTSGNAVLKADKSIIDGRNCYLNTGGNADLKFYIGEASYSTDTWCITGYNNMADFLYLTLSTTKKDFDVKFFQGTGLKHLQKPLLKKEKICIPPHSLIDEFNKHIQPMFNMISENIRENQELTSLRDWLLPLLMNGQVGFCD